SPPAMPPPVLTMTASQISRERGKRSRQPPVSKTRAASVRAPARAKARRNSARTRGSRGDEVGAFMALGAGVADLAWRCCPESTARRSFARYESPTESFTPMSWVPNQVRNDEAADAAQFLSRFGYVL